MTEPAMMTECARLDRWVTAYLDDELDAVHTLDVEDHAAVCEPCRERIALERAVRSSLRATKSKAPESLRMRAAAALLAERTLRDDAEDEATAALRADLAYDGRDRAKPTVEPDSPISAPSSLTRPKLVRLRYAMPLAVAASLALFAGASSWREQTKSARASAPVEEPARATAQMASTFDRFIDDLVDAHMQPPPPDVTDDDGLTQMNPVVGVRVARPEFTALGARFLGARMHHRQAAMLQYAVGDRRRVTLYVFDPSRLPVKANRLQPRVVENKHLYLGRIRGYAVAASERDGVGYALASDLSDQETEKAMVMAAR